MAGRYLYQPWFELDLENGVFLVIVHCGDVGGICLQRACILDLELSQGDELGNRR